MLAAYGMHLILARVVVPAEYGSFNLVYSAFSIVVLFVSAGVPPAVSRVTAATPGMAAGALRAGFILQICLSAIAAVLYGGGAGALAGLLSDTQLEPLIRLSAVGVPAYALMYLYNGYLGGLGRFSTQAGTTTIFNVGKVLLVALFATVWATGGAVLGLLVSAAVAAAAGGVLCRSARRVEHLSAIIRQISILAIPLTVLSLVLQLLLSMDLFIVKAILLDDSTVAVYSAASTIARAPYFLLTSMWFVLLPSASRAAANRDRARIANMATQAIRLVVVVGFPLVGLVTSSELAMVQVLYPAAYLGAAALLPQLVGATCLLSLFCLLSGIWSGVKGAALPAAVGGITAFVFVLIGLHLTAEQGPHGAATASLISAASCAGIMLLITARTFSARIPYWSVLRSACAAAVAAWIATGISVGSYGLLVTMVSWGSAYAGILLLLGEVSSTERAAAIIRLRQLVGASAMRRH